MLVGTPNEKLTNVERQRSFVVAVVTAMTLLPMYVEKMSLIEATDDMLAIDDDESI